jgi:hypothetical protein
MDRRVLLAGAAPLLAATVTPLLLAGQLERLVDRGQRRRDVNQCDRAQGKRITYEAAEPIVVLAHATDQALDRRGSD